VSTNGRIRNLRALFTSWENPKSMTSRNRADVAPRSPMQLYAQHTPQFMKFLYANALTLQWILFLGAENLHKIPTSELSYSYSNI